MKKVQDDSTKRARGRPKAFNDKTEQNTIKSLDRAIMVLEALAAREGPSLSELASDMGESPATLYRILTTLEARGLTETDPVNQTWHIGAGAFLIGSAFLRRTNVAQRAQPFMRALMEATGETANLGVWRGAEVLFISQVETHHAIRAFFPPGATSSFHASGVGKALASQLDDERLKTLIKTSGLQTFTRKTITEPDALMENLRASAARGYAVDDEERFIGMTCVAAPVLNAAGEAVAGLSVSGPVTRLGVEEVATAAIKVKAAAAGLSRAIGYLAPPE